MAKILLIEDEASLLEFYSELLETEGHTVLKAYDGEVGLQKALDDEWDIMFLDIMLPKLDGVELLKRLKTVKPDLNKVIIMLTNLDSTTVVSECMRLGAKEHLAKASISPDAILQVIEKYLPKKS